MMTVVTHFTGRSVTYLERVLSLTKFQIAYIFLTVSLNEKIYFERFKKGSQKHGSTKIFFFGKCKSNLVTCVMYSHINMTFTITQLINKLYPVLQKCS